ncbi:MAG: class I SAM-dependent methyltransferase [Pyrinomonadaceae bacterium]
MTEHELEQQIAASEAYEKIFVPGLFAQWTDWVLDLAGVSEGNAVLDVACGTGVLTRAAADRVGETGKVAGIDLSCGMVEVAKRLAPEAVDLRVASADCLPYEDGTFDSVVSQFGMMFFPDKPHCVGEMARVIGDEGKVAVAVWDDLESNPVFFDLVNLLDQMAGTAAADALRMPFSMGDGDELWSIGEKGGLKGIGIERQTKPGNFESIRTLVEGEVRGWLPVMGVHLDELLISEILDESGTALAAYSNDDGSATIDLSAVVLCGSKA